MITCSKRWNWANFVREHRLQIVTLLKDISNLFHVLWNYFPSSRILYHSFPRNANFNEIRFFGYWPRSEERAYYKNLQRSKKIDWARWIRVMFVLRIICRKTFSAEAGSVLCPFAKIVGLFVTPDTLWYP